MDTNTNRSGQSTSTPTSSNTSTSTSLSSTLFSKDEIVRSYKDAGSPYGNEVNGLKRWVNDQVDHTGINRDDLI